MPAKFDACVKAGGRVRRKRIDATHWMNFCIPKGGGKGDPDSLHFLCQQAIGDRGLCPECYRGIKGYGFEYLGRNEGGFTLMLVL